MVLGEAAQEVQISSLGICRNRTIACNQKESIKGEKTNDAVHELAMQVPRGLCGGSWCGEAGNSSRAMGRQDGLARQDLGLEENKRHENQRDI